MLNVCQSWANTATDMHTSSHTQICACAPTLQRSAPSSSPRLLKHFLYRLSARRQRFPGCQMAKSTSSVVGKWLFSLYALVKALSASADTFLNFVRAEIMESFTLMYRCCYLLCVHVHIIICHPLPFLFVCVCSAVPTVMVPHIDNRSIVLTDKCHRGLLFFFFFQKHQLMTDINCQAWIELFYQ